MINISVQDLKKLSNINIIDIRNREKYNDNHILNSISIPFNELVLNPSKYLNKNEIYYIYCQRGISSRKLCIMLSNLGYNVINIIGGYESWIMTE